MGKPSDSDSCDYSSNMFRQLVAKEYSYRLSQMSPKHLSRRMGRQLARKPFIQLNWDQIMDAKSKRLIQKKFSNKFQVLDKTANINVLKSCPEDKQLEQIMTTVVYERQICHLVKWEACRRYNLVANTAINKTYPQQVIQYYENNLKFLKNLID